MKAISLTQPWASLVAIGAKRIETRSWRPTSALGEDIAIHAAKSFPLDCRQLCDQTIFARALKRSWMQLPVGAVIAVVRVESYERTEKLLTTDGSLTLLEEAFGNYGPNRYGWRLTNLRPLSTPINCRGALGIWFLPPDVNRAVQAQLETST
jgi:activating signal cointegrator 1